MTSQSQILRTPQATAPNAVFGSIPLGAWYHGQQRSSFQVWAPRVEKVHVHLVSPADHYLQLRRGKRGYFEGWFEGVEPGARYFYRLNGKTERPDPVSRAQPEGVHGPSEVIDPAFNWQDQAWFGLPLRDYILYELHVGTFTEEGTFDAVIPHLSELKELGVTALELMPIAQFPGSRNWGYDGVYPFAVQESYGGVVGLKRLVNACHLQGLAVVLDVVYNHLGPEGNYLRDFGPYFTDRYRTPWGSAFNFDGEHNEEVRRLFLENALWWQTDFHIDALRLDAVHAIKDCSAIPFVQEVAELTRGRAERLNRRFYVIAESDLNDARLISPTLVGGHGLDAQWSDDFHHCLHVLLTGEQDGYYADFGGVRQLAKVMREGYAYTGQYSRFRKRRHGNRPRLNPSRQFVVFAQNHDQVGNRVQGERLSRLTDPEGLKLAAGAVVFSPFIPLLFMGEEYGEHAPFQYFISHTDPAIVEAVRQGRREEFAGFAWGSAVPDPQAESTFEQCILNRELRRTEAQPAALYAFYREIIRIRKTTPALACADKANLEAQGFEPEQVLRLIYHDAQGDVCVLLCFAARSQSICLELPPGAWRKTLDSRSARWGGLGSALDDGAALSSAGRVTLKLEPRSLLLYQAISKR